MEKIIYLLWGPRDQDRADRQRILLKEVAPQLLDAGIAGLTMYIVDPDADVRPPSPFHPGERICSEVAIWNHDPGKRGLYGDILGSAGFRLAGYLVDESIYTEYGGNRHAGPRDWPDGQRSPGIVTVTLMERPKRLSHEEWIRRWHGKQSPVSEAMQPRCRYIRNVVLEAITPDAPPFEGIVEEAWPTYRHATNMFLFYGAGRNPLKLIWNFFKMMRSVMYFLDITRIRSTMTSEYILKTRTAAAEQTRAV